MPSVRCNCQQSILKCVLFLRADCGLHNTRSASAEAQEPQKKIYIYQRCSFSHPPGPYQRSSTQHRITCTDDLFFLTKNYIFQKAADTCASYFMAHSGVCQLGTASGTLSERHTDEAAAMYAAKALVLSKSLSNRPGTFCKCLTTVAKLRHLKAILLSICCLLECWVAICELPFLSALCYVGCIWWPCFYGHNEFQMQRLPPFLFSCYCLLL